MSRNGARVLVAALLLITAGPWTPVLCFASGHLALEIPGAMCCGSKYGVATEAHGDPLLLSPTPASACGDCTDVPLVSVLLPKAAQETVNLETSTALVSAHSGLQPSFATLFTMNREECGYSPILEPCRPLRC